LSGRVEEGRIGAKVDDFGCAEAVLVANEELVFAGCVAEVGDGFAVGRPVGIAFGGSGSSGEVAGVAFFGGDGEDVSVGLEDGARAGGGDVGVADFLRGDGGEMGTEVGQVAVDGDVDGLVLMGAEVVEMEGAELFVDEGSGAGGDGFEVVAVIFD